MGKNRSHTKQSRRHTSTELVVGAVTVEVVTLAVLATVDLGRVVPFLALTAAIDTVSVVAALHVVFVAVVFLCPHFTRRSRKSRRTTLGFPATSWLAP